MLPYWKESPFVRILLPFAVGITACMLLPALSISVVGFALTLCCLLLGLFRLTSHQFRFQYSFLAGILMQLILFTSGYFAGKLHEPVQADPAYHRSLISCKKLLLRIASSPEEKEKTMKAEAEVLWLSNDTNLVRGRDRVILYFQRDEKNVQIHEGDHLVIANKLKDIRNSGNPGSFDYRRYCAAQHIFQTAYLKADEWQLIGSHTEDMHSFFAALNTTTRNVLRRSLKDSAAHGVAEALLLGYRGDIDEKTWQAYTDTGIVHIIAISGMHMAMVYGSVRWLLLLIPFFKNRKKTAILFALLFMWLFACLTGLPASVSRAAVMFTFIGWGEMQNQKTDTLNLLAAAAFFMLCANPFYLLDVGFQLSYLAVLSLIIFYPAIYRQLAPKYKVLDAVWKLCAMTLAAQILTLPVCLYYFHQFPLLFVITNLFAVPLTSIILYIEILLVMLSFCGCLAQALGCAVSALVVFTNNAIAFFSQLSFAVWSGIHISAFEVLLLYLLIFFLALFLWQRTFRYLILTMSVMLLGMLSLLYRQSNILVQQKIIVYNIGGQKSIEFINGNKWQAADTDSLAKWVKNEKYTFTPAHTFLSVRRAKKTTMAAIQDKGIELFSFCGKKIMRIEHTRFHTTSPLQPDLLILSKHCEPEPAWLRQNIQPKQIVLDASIPFWKQEAIAKKLACMDAPVHVVSTEGAFIMNLP